MSYCRFSEKCDIYAYASIYGKYVLHTRDGGYEEFSKFKDFKSAIKDLKKNSNLKIPRIKF